MANRHISKEVLEEAQELALSSIIGSIKHAIGFYTNEAEKESEKEIDDSTLYMFQFALGMVEANKELLNFLEHFKF